MANLDIVAQKHGVGNAMWVWILSSLTTLVFTAQFICNEPSQTSWLHINCTIKTKVVKLLNIPSLNRFFSQDQQ